jgi:alkylated DNA repair dioxygenase AlkB
MLKRKFFENEKNKTKQSCIPFQQLQTKTKNKKIETKQEEKKKHNNRCIKIFNIPLPHNLHHAPIHVYSALHHHFVYRNQPLTFKVCFDPIPDKKHFVGYCLLVQTSPVSRPLLNVYVNLLDSTLAARLFENLNRDERWKRYTRPDPKQFKEVPQPRYQIGFNKHKNQTYEYSILEIPPTPFSKEIQSLDERLNQTLGCACDFYLGNLYEPAHCPRPNDPKKPRPDLDDMIGEHSDKEDSLDPAKPIVSVSLGNTRKLCIRVRKELAPPDWTASHRVLMELDMTHGSVLEFLPGMQSVVTHEVPRRTQKEIKLYPSTFVNRINLTGRILSKK